MKRLSWKYIAGLVDSHGSFDFQCHTDQRNKEPRLYIVPRMRITMTVAAKDVLDMMRANFGGDVGEAKPTRQNPDWQPACCWQVRGKQLRPLLQNIVNHLVIKKEQTKLCIWWIDRCMGRQFSKLNSVESVRQCARDELRAMKADPHRLSGKAIQSLTAILDGCDSRTNAS